MLSPLFETIVIKVKIFLIFSDSFNLLNGTYTFLNRRFDEYIRVIRITTIVFFYRYFKII